MFQIPETARNTGTKSMIRGLAERNVHSLFSQIPYYSLFWELFALKQWLSSLLKHNTVPRVINFHCFYVKKKKNEKGLHYGIGKIVYGIERASKEYKTMNCANLHAVLVNTACSLNCIFYAAQICSSVRELYRTVRTTNFLAIFGQITWGFRFPLASTPNLLKILCLVSVFASFFSVNILNLNKFSGSSSHNSCRDWFEKQ